MEVHNPPLMVIDNLVCGAVGDCGAIQVIVALHRCRPGYIGCWLDHTCWSGYKVLVGQ